MFDFLNEIVIWWHWMALGLLLLLLELLSGTFFILIFAIASLIVGITTFLIALSFNSELILWIIISFIGIYLWYNWLKNKEVPKSGQSNYKFDTKGVVIEDIKSNQRGKVRFDAPVLGNSVWLATSNEDLKKGDRVAISSVNGQLIKVKRI